MRKILLLGGGGFIGANIADQYLSEKNVHVTIADNFSRGSERITPLKEKYLESMLSVVDIDLTDYDSYGRLTEDYDIVYLLAALVGVDKVNKIPHEVIRINTQITMCCLEWLKLKRPRRVLFTSTSETYAGTVDASHASVPTAENVPLMVQDISHPRFTYAITKMLGESGLIHYANAGYFEGVIVRYHNVYGPQMGFRHVIPHLVERFLRGEDPFKIYGHDQTRAFNFISDAVSGTILAAEAGDSGEIFHIGDVDEISIEELTKFVGERLGFDGKYQYEETFPGSVSRRCPDISKARLTLQYEPKVKWREGVSKTVDWYLDYLKEKNSNSESFYDQYGIKR